MYYIVIDRFNGYIGYTMRNVKKRIPDSCLILLMVDSSEEAEKLIRIYSALFNCDTSRKLVRHDDDTYWWELKTDVPHVLLRRFP